MEYIPCIVNDIFVAYFIHTFVFLDPYSYLTLSLLLSPSHSQLVTTSFFSISVSLCYLFIFFVIFTSSSYFFRFYT